MNDGINKSGQTVLRAGFLIDGINPEPLENTEIVIEKGLIVNIGRKGAVSYAKDAHMVDCPEMTVMPGLIDCHVHYGGTESPYDRDWVLESDIRQAIISVSQAQKSMDHGFTTVRDISGNGIHLRNLINQGVIRGPRIIACGKGLSRTGGHGDAYEVPLEKVRTSHPWAIICDGEEEVQKGVRTLYHEGSDCIKLWASGGGLWEKERETDQHYSFEEIRTLVEEAGYVGLPVAAHCESLSSAKDCVKAGVTSIEHGEELDEECLILMKKKDITLVPTFGLFVEWFSEYDPPRRETQALYPGATIREKELNRISANFKAAKDSGIRIAVGADSFCDSLTPYGEYTLKEIRAIAGGGMTPMEAIIAATRSGAELLRVARVTGTLEPGKAADMVVMRENPLDDINRMNYDNIMLVMKEGVTVRNSMG